MIQSHINARHDTLICQHFGLYFSIKCCWVLTHATTRLYVNILVLYFSVKCCWVLYTKRLPELLPIVNGAINSNLCWNLEIWMGKKCNSRNVLEYFVHASDMVRYIHKHLGAVSIRQTVLPGMAIPMLKIRRPNGRLIFNMEIAIRR